MKTIYLLPGDDLTHAREIRTAVFVDEQGFENEFDSTDPIAHHVLIYDEGAPVGTARFFPDDKIENRYIIGRIAVLKDYRGKGYGRDLVLAAEDYAAKNLGGTSFYLGAQEQAAGFYKKLGYKVCGEMYLDEKTPHLPMEKAL